MAFYRLIRCPARNPDVNWPNRGGGLRWNETNPTNGMIVNLSSFSKGNSTERSVDATLQGRGSQIRKRQPGHDAATPAADRAGKRARPHSRLRLAVRPAHRPASARTARPQPDCPP